MSPKNCPPSSNAMALLRSEAEAKLDHASSPQIAVQSAEELLQELLAHQIELQMQNETLRQSLIDLEESRDRYIDFYDFAPTGYITLTQDAFIAEINLTGAKLLGKERGNLIKRHFAAFVAPEDKDHWHLFFHIILKSANKISCELKLLGADGTHLYTQLDCLRLRDNHHDPLVRIVLTDISNRRQTEESLRQSAEEMRDIYNNAPCGYHSLDKDEVIRRINDTELAWLGYTREEVVGKMKWTELITPACRKTFRDSFPQFLKQGFVHDLEFEMIRKDGTRLIGLVSASALFDLNGDFLMSRSTVFDITVRKQLEAALLISENQRHQLEQQEIVQTSLDDFWVVNANDGRILKVNDKFCDMLGYTREEILGMNIQQLDAIETTEETEARIKKIREVGYDRFETRHRHKLGHLIDFEVSVTHSAVSGGTNFAFFRDITERKQAEQFKQSILNSVSAEIAVLDRNGVILAVNQPWRQFALDNCTACENSSKSKGCGKLLPGVDVGTDYLATCQPNSINVTDEGKKARLGICAVLEGRLKNFSIEYACHSAGQQRWFRMDVTPFGDSANNGAVITHTDITDRIRAEEAVKQSLDQLKAFIEQAPISIAMFDRDMNYLAVSGRWMTEYSRGYPNLIGRNHYEVHPDIPENWKVIHALAQTGVSTENKDELWIQIDGNKHWLRWSFLPWLNEHHQIGGIIISTEDITDTKMREIEMAEHRKEMEHQQKMHVAAQTASALAHEMNQPLLAIASYSQAALMMMKAPQPDYDEIGNAIAKSEQQALRAGRAIRDLIEFLSIKDFLIEPIDLNKEVIKIVNTAKSERNLIFDSVLNLNEDLPLVRANRTHIQKVLLNLLHNGIDAMQSANVHQPTISLTVRTADENNFVQLTIRDNGPGIRKEDFNRLFEPFFTTKTKGIGMGLAISRSLIEENGGRLWVESQEGLGATFHLTLPFEP